jgi:hypothetical protein
MLHVPSIIAALYRPATDRDIHSRSFGLVKLPRNRLAEGWEQRRGTLEDQSIFGPLRDFECACRKYRGSKYKNMICDRCGVKVTTRAARRQRFGHIDLQVPVLHPLGQSAELLSTIPVLPAVFFESHAGKRLGEIYDELVRSVLVDSSKEFVTGFHGLLDMLLPIATFAHEWGLEEAETLAWGLALEVRLGPASGTCSYCGYPLEGLDVPACPGCGNKLG